MRKNRVVEQDRCYHLISRLAHRAFFLVDEEKDRAVALMRRIRVLCRDASLSQVVATWNRLKTELQVLVSPQDVELVGVHADVCATYRQQDNSAKDGR